MCSGSKVALARQDATACLCGLARTPVYCGAGMDIMAIPVNNRLKNAYRLGLSTLRPALRDYVGRAVAVTPLFPEAYQTVPIR